MFEWFLDLSLGHIMGVFDSLNYAYCPIRIILVRIPPLRVFFSQYIYLLTSSRNWEGWLWLHLEYIDVKYYVCCLDACTYGFDTYIYIIIYKPRNHLVNLILKLLHYEFILHPFRHEASQMNILRVKMLFGFDTYRITC